MTAGRRNQRCAPIPADVQREARAQRALCSVASESAGSQSVVPSSSRWVYVAVLLALVAGGVVGWRVVEARRDRGPGATAIWTVSPPPKSSDTSFTAEVTRLGCSSGMTGNVREPDVVLTSDEITVTFTVDPLPDDSYNCIGNPSVSYEVNLGEPVGDRKLVDGACNGEAAGTDTCVEGGV